MAYLRLVNMPFLLQIQLTTTTFIWALVCFALGVGYAMVLYRYNRTLPPLKRNIFFVLRAVMISILAFLLFAPLVRSVSRTLEKPIIILAQDNSASLGISRAGNFNVTEYARRFTQLEKILSNDYEVHSFHFGGNVSGGLRFDFNSTLTNISAVFELINDRFANRNIGAVVLASDGIYNRGGNPQYVSQSIQGAVYTIALGDTIPKRDVLISNVNYNNIAYLNNDFQVEVNLEAFQSKGGRSRLTVAGNNGVVYSKDISITSNEFRQTIPLTLLASAKGIQKYTVSILPVSGELSKQNNYQSIYVEVIDGRQNVLIVANAPHPDISTLKQSIEVNKSYEVKAMLAEAVKPEDIGTASVIILHQLPSQTNSAQAVLKLVGNKPVLFVIGAETSSLAFSNAQPLLSLESTGATQEVMADVRDDFYAFSLSKTTTDRLSDFAPLLSPFGNYVVKGPASVLLSQQIGRVSTKMPLLAFGEYGQRKVGVLAGEGIWRWWLEEFADNSNHQAVNEVINKTVQYLSTTQDNRKFRVYTNKNTFDENERIVLNAELYDDAYELINIPDVKINIKSSSAKSYSYVFSRSNNSYTLDAGVLPPGEYIYNASTQLGEKRYTANGRFVIVQQQAETLQTTANHQLLYSMAKQNEGTMIYADQLDRLPQLIRANENIKTVSYENRKYEEMIDLKWIFFVILGLLSLEWFSRKRNGEI